MKILSVTAGYLSYDAQSWRTWNIAKLLHSEGHKVHLIQYARKFIYEKLKDNKLDLGGLSNSVVKGSRFTFPIKHLKELKKGNYNLVYGNTHFGAFYSILGKLNKIPLLFDMHGDLVEEFLLNHQSNQNWKYSFKLFDYFLKKVIDFVDLHFSNKIIAVSRKMINYINEEKGVPLDKIIYIPNGVNLNFFKCNYNKKKACLLKKEMNLENKFIFGYLGNFDKWQGVENFIKATERIEDKKLAFVIVGGNKKAKKGNLILIPRVPRCQILDYYSICDVLVLPRPSHPATQIAAPTKFSEYTAMGKPVLTTNVGDAADLVKKYKCGVVFKDNNPQKLIEGIIEFKSKSEIELKKMGTNSRRLAENEFDWNNIKINLLKAVEEFK